MFGKKKPAVDYNGPRAVIERDMGKYEISTTPYNFDLSEAARLMQIKNKVIQLLADENLTYKETMQLPAILKADLSLSFQNDMLRTIVRPLSQSTDQRNEGDHGSSE